MMEIKEALICFVCSVLSATAVGQQIYVKQPYDGYAEGQTIYIDSQGGKYVLHPDGRTRVTPMFKIDGCDIGLKWAPIAGIYWCPTYTSNPDLVTPPTPVTSNPPSGSSADEQAYQQWLYDWNNYQAVLAYQAAQQAAQVNAWSSSGNGDFGTPGPIPGCNAGCATTGGGGGAEQNASGNWVRDNYGEGYDGGGTADGTDGSDSGGGWGW